MGEWVVSHTGFRLQMVLVRLYKVFHSTLSCKSEVPSFRLLALGPFEVAASTCLHSVGVASNQINRITVNSLSVVVDTIFIGQRCNSVPIPRSQK